jgi:hypothetical protein
MSNFDAESYAAAWRRRNEDERERIKNRIPRAFGEAMRLARLIVAEAGVEKVILFGSLAEDTIRNENFDIHWFKAREIAEGSSFKVDVIEYDAAPIHVRKRIDKKGVILWPENERANKRLSK